LNGPREWRTASDLLPLGLGKIVDFACPSKVRFVVFFDWKDKLLVGFASMQNLLSKSYEILTKVEMDSFSSGK
jgi:hypothetical protein